MNERIEIRRARREDLPAIVALLLDDTLGAQRESLADLAPYEAAFQAIDADPRQYLAVMERDGAIIGTQQLTFLPGLSYQGATRLQIEAVRIAASARGGGLGTMLIEWAIAYAREHDCFLVQLSSNSSRLDAHRFYQRLGFDASHTGFKLKLR